MSKRKQPIVKPATSVVGQRPSELGRKFGRRKGPGRPRLAEVPSPRDIVKLEKKRAFITALAKHGTVLKAAAESGCKTSSYYFWTDPKAGDRYGYSPPDKYYDQEFVDACVEAKLLHDQKIMDAGYDRAINGWINTHYDSQGNVLREEFRYDSSILQMLMKKADPQLKEKPPEINVDARQQNVNVFSAEVLDNLSPQQKRLLLQAARLEEPVSSGGGS